MRRGRWRRVMAALRDANPVQERLFLWAMVTALAGMGFGLGSIILLFTWAATRMGWMLAASHWLNWCTFGCAAAVWGCALLAWRARRRAN